MLKNISPVISPELLKILMEMGHGDEIVIGDGNFPAASVAQRLVRLDGHGVNELLEAVLKLNTQGLCDKTECISSDIASDHGAMIFDALRLLSAKKQAIAEKCPEW